MTHFDEIWNADVYRPFEPYGSRNKRDVESHHFENENRHIPF